MKIFILNTKSLTKTDMLYEVSAFAETKKIVTSKNRVLKAFVDREEEFSTAFENEIAIPHARTKEIIESAIVIARNASGIEWKSLDGKPTKYAISLLIEGGENAGSEHMEVLATVSSLLIDPKNVEVFKKGTIEQIEKLIAEKSNKQEVVSEDYYDFVAVTSCPTGVAHTNMAAEALERFAKENGLKAKVERQAAQGVVSPLSQDDVVKAKHVIIAVGRQIDGWERFDGKKLIKVGVAAPLKDANKLWVDVQKADKYVSDVKPTKGGATSSSSKGVGKVSIMTALMTGLSYMIPIVIVGGIFLAFGLGIGRIALGNHDVTASWQSKDPLGAYYSATQTGFVYAGYFWHVLFQIGVVGINLSVIVLGAFIAQAIGGRLALTPALIISAVCQGVASAGVAGGAFYFNWQTLHFGVDGNTNLSFFGSIAAGFVFGYGAKYWTIYVSPKLPKWVKTIEPIIIVPILFVFIGWFLFGFFFYLPLYWLAYGLGKGVDAMVAKNLMWIVGLIGGAMLCFDLGGPVNKIAFGLGVIFIGENKPEVMGAIAAAGSVGPVGMALGWLIGAKVFNIAKLRDDAMLRDSFVPALFMGFVGISEGAIPFTLRNPKTAVVSNVIGGAIAGAISGAFLITDNAAHTGPIVYLLGAIGKGGNTDYAYGLLYIMAFAVGSVVTALLFAGLELFIDRQYKKGVKINFSFGKLFGKKSQTVSKIKRETELPAWNGYAWKQVKTASK